MMMMMLVQLIAVIQLLDVLMRKFSVGCEFTVIACEYDDACTEDSCDYIGGCQISCDDKNECKTDSVNGCEWLLI